MRHQLLVGKSFVCDCLTMLSINLWWNKLWSAGYYFWYDALKIFDWVFKVTDPCLGTCHHFSKGIWKRRQNIVVVFLLLLVLGDLSLLSSFLLICLILIILFVILSVFLHFDILILILNLLCDFSLGHFKILLVRCHWFLNCFMDDLQRVYFYAFSSLAGVLCLLKIDFNYTAVDSRRAFNYGFFNNLSVLIHINLLLSSLDLAIVEFDFLNSCSYLSYIIRLSDICNNDWVAFLHYKWIKHCWRRAEIVVFVFAIPVDVRVLRLSARCIEVHGHCYLNCLS